MFTPRAAHSLSANIRNDVFLGRGRNLRGKALRKVSNVWKSTGPSRRSPRRWRCTVRADASSELEDGQIEGIEGYGAISTKPATPLLDTVDFPAHLKNFTVEQLKQVAKELRADLIYNVSQTGGHLGSSLGVIELTVALNYVFDQPNDRIIWDVGHQAYPHKMLTGRRDRMNTMRQTNGSRSPFI